ncbi:MAG: hypothetical protein Q9M29_04770, partial [Mariprofundaceae bacterium]|nr:hypothetical protein [Mariprofundaceae bacterium]
MTQQRIGQRHRRGIGEQLDQMVAQGDDDSDLVNIEAGEELHIFTQTPLLLGELLTIVQAFGLTAIQEAVVEFG